MNLEPPLDDLVGVPEIEYEAQEPSLTDEEINTLAVQIEQQIQHWDNYIENEMPEFRPRNAVTPAVSVEDMMKNV